MVLKEYAKYINDLVKIDPNAEVVYASDAEGNSYEEVFYKPSLQKLPKEFKHVSKNAVCIIN